MESDQNNEISLEIANRTEDAPMVIDDNNENVQETNVQPAEETESNKNESENQNNTSVNEITAEMKDTNATTDVENIAPKIDDDTNQEAKTDEQAQHKQQAPSDNVFSLLKDFTENSTTTEEVKENSAEPE